MQIEDMESRGKDILAERREKIEAQEPVGKWALFWVVTFVGVFMFAYFVMPLQG